VAEESPAPPEAAAPVSGGWRSRLRRWTGLRL
jgi:hypothetical protein